MRPAIWTIGLCLAVGALALPGRAARPRPKPPDILPAIARLEAQASRLDPLAYAVPAARACAEACDLYGPRQITYRPGEALCECNRIPQLQRHRVPPPGQRAAIAAGGGGR